jgi:hypothetical protein
VQKLLLSTVLAIFLSSNINPAQADLITFDFTGRLTVISPDGYVLANSDAAGLIDPWGYQTPITATLTFDTATGIGSSNIQTATLSFFGLTGYFHDADFTQQLGTNLLDGTILADWGPNSNMISRIQWDATGMINAIDYGLQAGDKISGTTLYRDFNHDGQYDASEIIVSDLGSAIPYTDSGLLVYDYEYGYESLWYPNQGPAPMAATVNTIGLIDGPFPGMIPYLDIGSGNSMYVTSVQAVPLPAAVWLFGSGLLGLMALARRRR